VTAYAISRRTSEIGVRMALGAQPSSVLWLVLRQVAALASIGVALGVPAAIVAGPLVQSLLYGVAPNDWRAISAASVVMVVVALLAGLQPALRAARVHPLSALRAE
jgi:ABC-type antimicrobial peptide transport system permease subunit